MNVGDVLKRSASNFPDKTALIFGDQRIDYRTLNIRVNCLSNSLLDMGLKKGDRVAVLLHNCPEFIEIYFACAKSGGIIVPINNLLRIKELQEILEHIEPRFLIFDKEFDEIVQTSSVGINRKRQNLGNEITVSSICAIGDKTYRGVLDFQPTQKMKDNSLEKFWN